MFLYSIIKRTSLIKYHRGRKNKVHNKAIIIILDGLLIYEIFLRVYKCFFRNPKIEKIWRVYF